MVLQGFHQLVLAGFINQGHQALVDAESGEIFVRDLNFRVNQCGTESVNIVMVVPIVVVRRLLLILIHAVPFLSETD